MKSNKKSYLQKKSKDMNKKVFLQFVFLTVLSGSFAQVPGGGVVVFEEISVSNKVEVKIAELECGLESSAGQQKSNGYRNLFFIHGLGGTAKAWGQVSVACEIPGLVPNFPARKCESHLLDYNEYDINILLAAKETSAEIRDRAFANKNTRPPEKNILIAHSQGGIVCRAIMHLDFVQNPGLWQSPNSDLGHKGYGGLVTVASSLQGAWILNNRPLIHKMADDACNALVPAGVATTKPIMRWLVVDVMGTDGICGFVSGDILKLFFSNYYKPITESYVINGEKSKIDTFNKYADHHPNYPEFCNMPKVAFYAVEPQENIMWRTANWLGFNADTDPNLKGYFEANDDWKFYNDYIEPMYVDFRAGYKEWLKKYNNADWYWFIPGFGGAVVAGEKNKAIKQMQAFQKGIDWLDKANEDWKVIIGAKEYVQNPNPKPQPPIPPMYYPKTNPDPRPTPPVYCLRKGVSIFSGGAPCLQVNPNYDKEYAEYLIALKEWESYPQKLKEAYKAALEEYYIAYAEWNKGSYWKLKPENDGIVLAESAMNLPCAQYSIKICPEKTVTIPAMSPSLLPQWCKLNNILPMPEYSKGGTFTVKTGSSHMQVRNDEGIKEHLFNLFEGDYGWFFKTDKWNE